MEDIKLEDKRLYLEKSLNQTQSDVATLLKFIYKNHLRFHDKKWYYFNSGKWEQRDKSNSPLLKLMSQDLVNEYLKLANYYNDMVSQNLQIQSTKEINKTTEDYNEIIINDYICKSRLCSEICLKLNSKNFCFRVNTICEKLFEDFNIDIKMNGSNNLLAFNNGVYELFTEIPENGTENETGNETGNEKKIIIFRDIKPIDFIFWDIGYSNITENKIINYSEILGLITDFLRYIISDSDDIPIFYNYLGKMLFTQKESPMIILTDCDHELEYVAMFKELLEKVFGNYFYDLPPYILRKKKFTPKNPQKDLYNSLNKRLCYVIHDGVNDKDFNIEIIQQLLNHRPIMIRDLYKEPTNRETQFGIIMTTKDSDFNPTDLNKIDCLKLSLKTKLTEDPNYHTKINNIKNWMSNNLLWRNVFINELIKNHKNYT